MTNQKKFTRGFTLNELLVSMAVIGLLAAIILANLNSARVKADDAARLITAKELVKAMNNYYLDNQYYPNQYDASGVYLGQFGTALWRTVDNDLVAGSYYPSSIDSIWLSGAAGNNFVVDETEVYGFGMRIYQEDSNSYCRVGVNMNPLWWNPGPNPPIEIPDCF